MAVFRDYFYHKTIETMSLAFGSLFVGLQFMKYNPDGTEHSRQLLPIELANKSKWYRRKEEDPNLDRKQAIILPRAAYEMTKMEYDPSRKLNKTLKFQTNTGTSSKEFVRSPVPYNFHFRFYIISKTLGELYQVIEQIVPGFTPDNTISVKLLTSGLVSSPIDIPISLLNIEISDSYEGSLEDRRVIEGSLDFVMKGYLFGPMKSNNIIKHVETQFYNPTTEKEFAEIVVEPFIDGVPLSEIKESDAWKIAITIDEDFSNG